jgi:hypothetical protein
VGRTHGSGPWSETEIDYKARQDLIPRLEETLRAYTFDRREGPGKVAFAFSGGPATMASGDPNALRHRVISEEARTDNSGVYES